MACLAFPRFAFVAMLLFLHVLIELQGGVDVCLWQPFVGICELGSEVRNQCMQVHYYQHSRGTNLLARRDVQGILSSFVARPVALSSIIRIPRTVCEHTEPACEPWKPLDASMVVHSGSRKPGFALTS